MVLAPPPLRMQIHALFANGVSDSPPFALPTPTAVFVWPLNEPEVMSVSV